MGKNYSISSVMPNLLLGLCKGSKILEPYSKTFKSKLGFQVFRFELSFLLTSNERITPDAIISSLQVGNTVVFEWTGSLDPLQKQQQLIKYSHVTTADLENNAAVPKQAVQNIDIAIVIKKDALAAFSKDKFVSNNSFPLLILDIGSDEILFQKAVNNFKVENVDEFFSEQMIFRRIPRYIPIPIDSPNPQEIVTLLVREITSALVTGKQEVSLEEICSGFIPAWKYIDKGKQKVIADKVKELVIQLINEPFCSSIIRKKSGTPNTWELSPNEFKQFTRSYHRSFIQFIAEITQETFQYTIDFPNAS